MEYLQVTFRLHCAAAEAESLAESVLLEQTIETPSVVAERYPFVRENMLGRIADLQRLDDGSTRAVLQLPTLTAGVDPAQFLNVLFGNASLHEKVTLEDFIVPPTLLARFPGPRFGIEGLREKLQIHRRPLTCSALKPVGLTTTQLATLCETFARGGIDIIKDDHYLSDQKTSPFRDRVRACQQAIARASDETGHRACYCPNLSGTPETLRRQAEYAQEQGVGAVMMAPMLVGIPAFLELVQTHLEVPVLVHPSFAGANRIHPVPMHGNLLRMIGGDAVIFANFGGRFSYPRAVCAAIAERVRRTWAHVAPSFPVPAGGMTVERTDELVNFFGSDTILLVGGSLLAAGEALLERTLAFTKAVAGSVRTHVSQLDDERRQA